MERKREILQSLEDLKNRAHELKTPEEVAKFVSSMPIKQDLRLHLYHNLVEEGSFPSELEFSAKKAIAWIIKEIKQEIGEGE